MRSKIRQNIRNKVFDILVVITLFGVLVLSGGCGGGGTDSPKLTEKGAVTVAAEKQEAEISLEKEICVAVAKEDGMADDEAFKEAGFVGAGDVETGGSESEQKPQTAEAPKRKLRSVVLGASTSTVNDIEEVIVPGNVNLIGMNAFDSRWSSLKRVIIRDTNIKLSYRTFNGCPNLEAVYIGDSTAANYFDFKSYINAHSSDSYSYPEQAFYNCPKLKCVSFGNVAPPAGTAFINSCGGSVGGTVIEAPYAKYSAYSSRLGSRYTVTRKTWSESFPDTMLVNQISIPGTHDSCTYQLRDYGGVDVVEEAQTQTKSLEEQLSLGVRCFDLRPFHESGYSDPVIHHGPISCKQTFHSAIDKLCNHLKSHPRDFLIAMVNHEGFDTVNIPGIVETEYCENHSKTSGDNQIQDELQSWKNAGYAVDFKPGMTVKDMRGKILFLSRDFVDGRNPVGAYLRNWGGNTYTASIQSSRGQVNLMVQDKYKAAECNKLNEVRTKLNDFAAYVRNDHSYTGWCINHTSAYEDESYMLFMWVPGINYPYNAQKVNGPTASDIGGLNGPTGIVVMDFAGKEDRSHYNKTYDTKGQTLLDAIINHNF